MDKALYYRSKRDDLEKALEGFSTLLQKDLDGMDLFEQDVYKNASIQKFEYSIELFWKVAKQYLSIVEGVDETSPRSVLKALFRQTDLTEGQYEALDRMVKDRNLLSHMYSLDHFEEIYARLRNHAETLRQAASVLPLNL